MSGFALSEFNNVLPEMEGAFEESWTLGGTAWPAISIDRLSATSQVIKGGQLLDVNTTIFIRETIYLASGVKKGDKVDVRDQTLMVLLIEDDGDASRAIHCGPYQLDF